MVYLSIDDVDNMIINVKISDLLFEIVPIRLTISSAIKDNELEYLFESYASPKPWLYDSFLLPNGDWKQLSPGDYTLSWYIDESNELIEQGWLRISGTDIIPDVYQSPETEIIIYKK